MEIINTYFKELVYLCLIIIGSVMSYFVTKKYILYVLKKVIDNTNNEWNELFFEHKIFHYIIYLTPAPIIYLGSFLFPTFQPTIEKFILVYVILIIIFLLEKILSVTLLIYNRFEISKKRPIQTFIQAGKIMMYFVGLLCVLSIIFNKSIITFLSGLGALTAVLMIVFKDSLLSFKAGAQLISNDMLRIGDWIEIPKYGADGDVIEISLDTIKIKNWDKTITFIPTYKLMEEPFKNWRGMLETGARRIFRAIIIDQQSIRFLNEKDIEKLKKIHLISDYILKKKEEVDLFNKKYNIDTSIDINGKNITNIGTFRIYILNYLKNHPDIKKDSDLPLLVRQMDPTSSGIPLQIYAFTENTEFSDYEQIQSDIFDHLLSVVSEFDLKVFQHVSNLKT